MSQPSTIELIKFELARILALGCCRLLARQKQLAECGEVEPPCAPVDERPDTTQEANR